MVPHLRRSGFLLTATLLVTIGFESTGQDLSSTKKPFVRMGQESTLSGTVTFTGKSPKPVKIDMSADPSCYEYDPDPKTEWFVVNNEKLANVLVYVTSNTLDNYSFEPPTSAVELQHKACRYEPHVLGIQARQPLMIMSGDSTHHNTHPNPQNNPEWNQTQPPGAPPIVKTFQRAEVLIPFKDNQHPWEKAYVSVFNHPFFAVSDAEGNYKIAGLPPGTYKITVWHEKLGEKTAEIILVPGESRYLGFAFGEADLKDYKAQCARVRNC